MDYASNLDTSAQVFALNKQVAALEARLVELDRGTKAHVDALEATIKTLQAQHTAGVQGLETKVQSLEVQVTQLKNHPNASTKAPLAYNIPTSQPGKPKPLLLAHRQDCIKGRQCSETSCPFTHPRQRAYFKDAIDELPVYNKKGESDYTTGSELTYR